MFTYLRVTEIILCNHELLFVEMSLIQLFSCHTIFILFMNVKDIISIYLKGDRN